MAKQIPITLVIDNQNRALGIKQFSLPDDEVLGVSNGGTGSVIFEEDSVLLGNEEEPIQTISRKTLTSNGSISVSENNSFVIDGKLEILVDDTKLNLANILSPINKIPLNRIGSLTVEYNDLEEAETGLSPIIDLGDLDA